MDSDENDVDGTNQNYEYVINETEGNLLDLTNIKFKILSIFFFEIECIMSKS